MSETLKTEKAVWAEKKHHGSRKERETAVSVQTARMVDRLLERSKGLSGLSIENPNNALTVSQSFKGATEGSNKAVLTDSRNNYNLGEASETIAIATGEREVRPLFRKEKTIKTATIRTSSKDMLDPRVGVRHLEIDSEGKQKPVESVRFGSGDVHSTAQTPGQVIHNAAPALYEVKKAIDAAEEQAKRKAA